eukprot:6755247-Prymnesium_polylepis.2
MRNPLTLIPRRGGSHQAVAEHGCWVDVPWALWGSGRGDGSILVRPDGTAENPSTADWDCGAHAAPARHRAGRRASRLAGARVRLGSVRARRKPCPAPGSNAKKQ